MNEQIYSRQSPSPRYVELLEEYTKLHTTGDTANEIAAEDTFDGRSLMLHAATIRTAIAKFEARSLLDYGCGKAKGYEAVKFQVPGSDVVEGIRNFWQINDIEFYDPGYKPYFQLPDRQFDTVICTDVLEHCPEEDIDWILEEIFGLAQKFVYCTVALYPANKTFGNGTNVHITLKSPGWWLDKFDAVSNCNSGRKYFLSAMRSPKDMMFIES